MEDELWMRKIKERLEDYSEPLPVSGWERLEKDMPASKPKRRIIPFRRWAVAAAAVLLAAVSSVSIWLLQSLWERKCGIRPRRRWRLSRMSCRAGRLPRCAQRLRNPITGRKDKLLRRAEQTAVLCWHKN